MNTSSQIPTTISVEYNTSDKGKVLTWYTKTDLTPRQVSQLKEHLEDPGLLAEVREVLDALSVRYANGNRNVLCWCSNPNWDSTKPHEEACQRAQRLMARLRVDGAPGEGEDGVSDR